MFQELLTGTASSVSRRTVPGLVTRVPDKGLPTLASTCWNSWPTERVEEQGCLPQSSGHEPCGYVSGARLVGSVLLSQPPEDDLPQGALRHLAAIALAQARHKQVLEVTRI